MAQKNIIPTKVDSVTVIDLQNIEIGETVAFALPNFKKVRSGQSTASYYGKLKEWGKKFKTESRESDNVLIITAVAL